MLSITIGPLALPVVPLITLVTILVGATVAGRLSDRPVAARAENVFWLAAILGLIGARLAYVAGHWPAYAAHPWSILDIRDGGWLAWAGFLLAGVWLSRQAWRRVDLRRGLAGGAIVSLLIWGPAIALIHASQSGKQPAPAIDVVSLADASIQRTLPDVLAGKPAVVNLWATWCGPCRVEMPTLADAQKKHPEIQFVFVNQGEKAAAINRYLDAEKLQLKEVWLDLKSELGPAIGSTGLPTTVFYNSRGQRVDAHFGIISPAALAIKVDALN
jgi:thiol-disulfide isomerase/thioredoxin